MGKFGMKKPKGPCIDICDFSGPNGWCLGCGRTSKECAVWKKLNPFNSKIFGRQLAMQMSKMASSKEKLNSV